MLYETGRDAVWIDPLADPKDAGFWAWADARCGGREVSVLVTLRFHERSSALFCARYCASSAAPAGVRAIEFPELDETMYWLEAQRVLIPGDRLLGSGDGELRLCPQSWLAHIDPRPARAQLAARLGALLELDVEAVLVSHGEPVLEGGHGAIARALERA